ncbi:GTP-binding protein YPTM2 [Pelomyxa schiedti]|nr:GTP-binding protein YPTM2 [Pelomyxa schiedti]
MLKANVVAASASTTTTTCASKDVLKPPPTTPCELVKMLVIGDSAVGKTTLLLRYCEHRFDFSYVATIGVDFKMKTVKMGGKNYVMQIWDTAGHERFRTITASLYRDCMGIVLVYSIDDEGSFHSVKQWVHEITKNVGSDVSIVLVGNKSDLVDRRAVAMEAGLELAELFELPFFETSAKNSLNVDAAFMTLLLAIISSGRLDAHSPRNALRIPPSVSNIRTTHPAHQLEFTNTPESNPNKDTSPLIHSNDKCCS